MAKAPARLAELRKNSVKIGGIRDMTISWNGEPIDVTDADSVGVQALLGVTAGENLTISVSGVYTDPVLRDIAMTPATSKLLTDLTFKFADALEAVDVLSGNFYMTAYSEPGQYKEATMFEATFVSSGTWTRA